MSEGFDVLAVESRAARRLRLAAEANGVTEREAATLAIEWSLRNHEELDGEGVGRGG